MKQTIRTSFLSFILILSLATMPVNAARPSTSPSANRQNPTRSSNQPSQAQSQGQTKSQACLGLENAIMTRSQNMLSFTNRYFSEVDKIAQRVQRFQENENAKGNRFANYELMIDQIQQRRAEAIQTTTQAQVALQNFNCENDNPSASIQAFNQQMTMVKNALKNYHQQVRDLVASARANQQASSQGNQQGGNQ